MTVFDEYCIEEYGFVKQQNELSNIDKLNIIILSSYNNIKTYLNKNYLTIEEYEIKNVETNFMSSIPYTKLSDENYEYLNKIVTRLKKEINDKLELKNMS